MYIDKNTNPVNAKKYRHFLNKIKNEILSLDEDGSSSIDIKYISITTPH